MEKTILEIFTLVTGALYVVLEIRQKNFMWVLGIMTSLASMAVYFREGLYASFGLNTYYLITAFIGLWQWRRDRNRIEDTSGIHINRLGWKTVAVSAAIVIAGTPALAAGMEYMSSLGFKENPMSMLDACVAMLSATATWWLVKAYLEQWWLWIAANILNMILCLSQDLRLMAVLYVIYAIAAVIGLRHWKKHGCIVTDTEQ